MKRLYLMCGLAFSGKTILAKSIVQHLDAGYISLDDINKERGLGFGGQGIPVEEWEKNHQVAIHRLRAMMPNGRDLVLDDTNCLRQLRDRFRRVADEYRYHTIVVYLDIPLQTITQRMAHNELNPKRDSVDSYIFHNLVSMFEWPDEDEAVLTFGETTETDIWIRSLPI
ncbi:MAG: AAA family ATPase [Chloroflexota bacterium]